MLGTPAHKHNYVAKACLHRQKWINMVMIMTIVILDKSRLTYGSLVMYWPTVFAYFPLLNNYTLWLDPS